MAPNLLHKCGGVLKASVCKAMGTRLLRGSGAEARNFANKFMGFRNLQLRMPGRQILFPTEIAPASSLQIPERIQPAQSRSAGWF